VVYKKLIFIFIAFFLFYINLLGDLFLYLLFVCFVRFVIVFDFDMDSVGLPVMYF